MPSIEYPKLNRVQKTAVFLIVIGQESAANLVRSFADTDLEAVCREMVKLPVINDDVRQGALEEFGALVDIGFGSVLGGPPFVRGTLERARGEHRAAYLLERVAPGSAGEGEGASRRQFEGIDTREVYSLIKGEQAQTIAFMLSQLSLPNAGEILQMLGAEQRAEVLERLGEMEATPPDVAHRIAQQFKKSASSQKPATPAALPSGGAPFVASLLKTLDKETSRSLLAVLQDRNAALSDTIRKKLFSFDDVGTLTKADLQLVLREVDPADLAAALKGPRGEATMKKVMNAMSKRAAESLNDEIQMMNAVRPKDQEAAQDRILVIVRRLEEKGEITLDQGDQANAA